MIAVIEGYTNALNHHIVVPSEIGTHLRFSYLFNVVFNIIVYIVII
jgi:hypothetical protein